MWVCSPVRHYRYADHPPCRKSPREAHRGRRFPAGDLSCRPERSAESGERPAGAWYAYTLEVPQDCVGRAMADIQQCGGTFQPPETKGDTAVLRGKAPVAGLPDYYTVVTNYTHGKGRLFCTQAGYAPCENSAEIIDAIGYDCDATWRTLPTLFFAETAQPMSCGGMKWNSTCTFPAVWKRQRKRRRNRQRQHRPSSAIMAARWKRIRN